MAESQAATAAPGLSEEDLTKLGTIIGNAVKEAMSQQDAAAAAINAAAKGKAKNKKGKKADVSDNEQTESVEEQPNALTESILAEKLEAERKRVIDETREALVREGVIPARKGFRHVAETGEGGEDFSKLSSEELWNRRSELWSQALPLTPPQAVA